MHDENAGRPELNSVVANCVRKHDVEFLDRKGRVVADLKDPSRVYALHLEGLGMLVSARFIGEQTCFDMWVSRLRAERNATGINWRLPSMPELSFIADLNVYQPAMPQGFDETRGRVWTSTPCAWDNAKRYTMEVMTGTVDYQSRVEFANIIAVANYTPTPNT